MGGVLVYAKIEPLTTHIFFGVCFIQRGLLL